MTKGKEKSLLGIGDAIVTAVDLDLMNVLHLETLTYLDTSTPIEKGVAFLL